MGSRSAVSSPGEFRECILDALKSSEKASSGYKCRLVPVSGFDSVFGVLPIVVSLGYITPSPSPNNAYVDLLNFPTSNRNVPFLQWIECGDLSSLARVLS